MIFVLAVELDSLLTISPQTSIPSSWNSLNLSNTGIELVLHKCVSCRDHCQPNILSSHSVHPYILHCVVCYSLSLSQVYNAFVKLNRQLLLRELWLKFCLSNQFSIVFLYTSPRTASNDPCNRRLTNYCSKWVSIIEKWRGCRACIN